MPTHHHHYGLLPPPNPLLHPQGRLSQVPFALLATAYSGTGSLLPCAHTVLLLPLPPLRSLLRCWQPRTGVSASWRGSSAVTGRSWHRCVDRQGKRAGVCCRGGLSVGVSVGGAGWVLRLWSGRQGGDGVGVCFWGVSLGVTVGVSIGRRKRIQWRDSSVVTGRSWHRCDLFVCVFGGWGAGVSVDGAGCQPIGCCTCGLGAAPGREVCALFFWGGVIGVLVGVSVEALAVSSELSQ